MSCNGNIVDNIVSRFFSPAFSALFIRASSSAFSGIFFPVVKSASWNCPCGGNCDCDWDNCVSEIPEGMGIVASTVWDLRLNCVSSSMSEQPITLLSDNGWSVVTSQLVAAESSSVGDILGEFAGEPQ